MLKLFALNRDEENTPWMQRPGNKRLVIGVSIVVAIIIIMLIIVLPVVLTKKSGSDAAGKVEQLV